MPDDNNTTNNNQNNVDENNNQQNNSSSQQVVLACDTNTGKDQEYQDTVGMIIEQGGYQVEKLPIGPNEYATYSYSDKAKGKKGVYLIAAGLTSIADAYEGNTSFDYNVFGIRDDASSGLSSMEDFNSKPISKDWHGDCTPAICNELQGKSFPEINQVVGSKCQAVFGVGPEELGKNILAALGGSAPGGATSGSVGGSAVLIPDKTFYGLIKQIAGAVDAVFIIANNMAYLLSFKDFYEYRNQFDDFIPKIERKDVLRDSLTKNWSIDGYYNAVEVTYADGIVKYQNDVLVKQYGENTFYYEFPEDDEETAKAKADALLAAHVRDYSTNIQLSIFYNENITEGSWVKVHKSLTEISGKTRKEIEQEDIKKTGKKIETKHKGINITNLTEKTIKKDDITKKLQIITDEEGDKFEVEVEDTDYELFFVQSYTCRWDEHNSLIMDLELKYGPDTPEDPINATVGTGGVATGGSTSGTALSGNIGQLVAQWIQGKTNDLDKAKAIHEGLKAYGVVYAYYCNFKYNTPDECLQHCQNPGLNCGDTAHLTMECMKQGGLNAHIELRCDSAHFFCVIEINGQKYYSDLTADSGQKSQRPWNEVWQGNTCGNPYSSISAGDGSC